MKSTCTERHVLFFCCGHHSHTEIFYYLRTMNPIKVFNPEHDMSLANGDRHFIAPRNIREMARDLAPLLQVIEGNELLVWGWDHAIKSQLLRMDIAAEALPTDAALTALRKCSERQSAHNVLRAFHADHPDGSYTGESIIAHSLDEVADYATRHGHIILKDPLSSSGKGLRHVNLNEEGFPPPLSSKSSEQSEGGMSSSALNKVANWSSALIRRHGYLTAEPYYNKVQDFAMEFYFRDGECLFIGYSLFNTNHHGRYESNLLMEDERIEALLSRYIPLTALHEVRDWVISHSNHIIPPEWDTAKHPLYFGIDMMIVETTDERLQTNDKLRTSERDVNLLTNCPASTTELKTKFNSELKIQNSEFKIHPCVEINLRLNMGIIAHEVRSKLLSPNTEGTFHVTAFPTEEAAQQFYQEHIEQSPTLFQAEKIVSGYYPLTPIHPHTRHHAYVMCQEM